MDKKFILIFQPSGRRGLVKKGKTIRDASIEIGEEIEGVCGGKGKCGKCKVKIEKGFSPTYGIHSTLENLSPIDLSEKEFLSNEEQKSGYRLACQAVVLGDLIVFVPKESRLVKQIVRKTLRDIEIKFKPALKKYYLELPKATLRDLRDDWERLKEEFEAKYGLRSITIDYHVLKDLQRVVRDGDWKITISLWQEKEVIKVEPGYVDKAYGVAVDIGTTTLAAYLCDLTNGQLVATASMMNPQVVYGEDIMSRISYIVMNPQGLERLNQAVVDGINGIIEEASLLAGINPKDIMDMTVVGNTCMHHIFLNLDPRYLGRSPFSPAVKCSLNIKAREIGLENNLKISPGAYVHVLPIEAGFVGADNVGVLISEEPYNQDQVILIIDIGTNGELVLGNRYRLISCSCATGPAFEGAQVRYGMRASPGAIEKIEIDQETKEVRYKVIGKEQWNTELEMTEAKGICGSGIIDGVSQLFLAGIIDKTGRFLKHLNTPRYRESNGEPEFVIAWAKETSIGQDIVISQSDVRAIQLGKGAMYAGAKIMMRHFGVDKVDKVILAGAFGSYIDKRSAAILGLFPDCPLDHVYSVGNAAGDGARMALLNIDKRREADWIARKVEYIELTLEPDFDKIFAEAMWIPHKKDEFTNIAHILLKGSSLQQLKNIS
jgi:uncharacterized 2Fe-2S/4Fe-4S cluster protein (DUF4445 family)